MKSLFIRLSCLVNSESVPLLVLRFRDIERPIGQTIELHRDVINRRGTTWWGWLYRTYERCPLTELAALRQQLKAEPHVIGLYDTGQGAVYRATCRDVVFQDYLEISPDPGLTPEYYNGRTAPAWFQLSSIDDEDPDWIVGRVCAGLPSATEDCAIDLLGSQIYKLADLRRQEVTLWLIR
jgi:hypothetical protein